MSRERTPNARLAKLTADDGFYYYRIEFRFDLSPVEGMIPRKGAIKEPVKHIHALVNDYNSRKFDLEASGYSIIGRPYDTYTQGTTTWLIAIEGKHIGRVW